MHLPRIVKVVLGLFSAVPAVYVIVFVVLIARIVLWGTTSDPRARTLPCRCPTSCVLTGP